MKKEKAKLSEEAIMSHVSIPANKALTYDPRGMGGGCPCKKCRVPGMSFEKAMRLAVKLGELKAYGAEGVARREQEKKERLAALRKGK